MADSLGIPAQLIDDSVTRWDTALDAYSSSTHDLLWFFRPASGANFTEFNTAQRQADGSWCTEQFFNTSDPNWFYDLKVRAIDGHLVTDIATGTINVLVVVSDLEAQIETI